jgi:hypothetical protein
VNDRGKPGEDSIPIHKAWHCIAKLLFPQESVRWLTRHDRWLIDRYRLPVSRNTVFDDFDDRIPAPNELIAEVDRAYFRWSLEEEVNQWFTERGFDVSDLFKSIPKHLFEAAFQAEFGQLPFEPVKPVVKGAAKAKPRKPKQPRKRNKTDDALVAAPSKEPAPTKASKPESGAKPRREPSFEQAARNTAIQHRLINGVRPGSNVTWLRFCYAVRCDVDPDAPKNSKIKRGLTDDRITRVTRMMMKRLGI